MQPDFSRYACQITLPGFGELSQRMLQNAKVLIVGAGGLGCPAAQYLAAAGVGTIGIADDDVVSISNLHRQILFTPKQAGLSKTVVAATLLRQQNPDILLIQHDFRLHDENVLEVIKDYDIVLDCTDNIETKYLLNDACVLSGIPLVFGAIFQYEGQVAVFNVENPDGTRTANYRDIFPHVSPADVPNCAEGGVLPTLAGIIGCIQANETIKFLTQNGEILAGKMLLFDALTLQSRIIKTGLLSRTHITTLPGITKIPLISPAELKKNLALYELIDVRTPEEHLEFNIGGHNIPLDEIENIATYLELEKPVVVYCASGRRSAEAVKIINKLFIADIYSLQGGLIAW